MVQNQHTDVSVVQNCQMETSLQQDKESRKAVKWTKTGEMSKHFHGNSHHVISFKIKKTTDYLVTCNQLRCRERNKGKNVICY